MIQTAQGISANASFCTCFSACLYECFSPTPTHPNSPWKKKEEEEGKKDLDCRLRANMSADFIFSSFFPLPDCCAEIPSLIH